MNASATNLARKSGQNRIVPPAAPVPILPETESLSSQVAVTAFLTGRIPAQRIVERLAQALRAATGEPVLLLKFGPAPAGISLAEWQRLQPALNGEFGFAHQLERAAGGVVSLGFDLSGHRLEAALLAPMLAHVRRHFRRVVLYPGGGLSADELAQCIAQADATCVFLDRSADGFHQFDALARRVRERADGASARILPVLYLEAEERAYGVEDRGAGDSGPATDVEQARPPMDELLFLRDRTDTFDRQVRSLARAISGRRVGLALSSGGARGLAHIGVIQVLEENGIEIDAVAGCSMGAYIAAVWTYGFDGMALEGLAREIESRWGLWRLIDPALPPRRGFISGKAVIRRLKRSIGNAHFSDLVRPLRIVATNLATLQRTVFARGEVAAAVHASSAIPGVCVPVTIDGETYIDGGVTDPLPVSVLRELGLGRVIAVNTIPTPAYLQCCRELEREQAELRGRRPTLLGGLASQFNYFARGNVLDIMMRAVHGAQIRVAEQACLRADVVLRPLACDARWHDFTHPRKYIALGRQAAEEQLETIKALVKGTTHENDTTQNRMAVAV